MLTGIIPPTSGTAHILGFDMRFSMDLIRSFTGFCPQHDIHFEKLTVYEHLKLIASIKGYPKKLIDYDIKRISSFLGLENDLNKLSKNLSGGMKRRLSVGMALIGDSKVTAKLSLNY